MSNDNKYNLQYFESSSMRNLFELMKDWQNENQKRLLSTSIEKDGDKYCCIALTNPSEVVIVGKERGGNFYNQAVVESSGKLLTYG